MKYIYIMMLLFSLIYLFLINFLHGLLQYMPFALWNDYQENEKISILIQTYQIKKMKHNGCEKMMFKLIIVSFISIIVVLFVRLSYLKYIKQDLEQELDELEHKQKIKKGETNI